MPGYTSQKRQDEYDYLRFLSRTKIITPEVFASRKAIIDRREAKSVALIEKKETEKLARREAKKALTVQRNQAKKKEEQIKKEYSKIPPNSLRHRYVAGAYLNLAVVPTVSFHISRTAMSKSAPAT